MKGYGYQTSQWETLIKGSDWWNALLLLFSIQYSVAPLYVKKKKKKSRQENLSKAKSSTHK